MELISTSALATTSLLWQPRPQIYSLTIIAKATFLLQPGTCTLGPQQDVIHDEDGHWDGNHARSVRTPSDLAPFKTNVDILLVGSAYAPRKEPARSVTVRIIIGEFDKSAEVFNDRVIGPDGSIQEGARFLRTPLRWERAAGGPETINPVGIRIDPGAEAYGAVHLPNILPPGKHIVDTHETIAPVGFGPIASFWPERRDKLGRHRDTFTHQSLQQQPLPEDIDPRYFNCAPHDQQIQRLRYNERIILENLHPEHPRLVTALPGLHARAAIERRGTAEKLDLRADTLWIDTDRGVCTVTYRSAIALTSPYEQGRIVLSLVEEKPFKKIIRETTPPVDPHEQTGFMPAFGPSASALPFVEANSHLARPDARSGAAVRESAPRSVGSDELNETTRNMSTAGLTQGVPAPLPFRQTSTDLPAVSVPASTPLAPAAVAPAMAHPHAPQPIAPATQPMPAPVPAPAIIPAVAVPQIVPTPPAPPVHAPAPVTSAAPPQIAVPRPPLRHAPGVPIIGVSDAPPLPPIRPSIGQVRAGVVPSAGAPFRSGGSSNAGVLDASNAAAGNEAIVAEPPRPVESIRIEPVVEPKTPGKSDALRMLWFDSTLPARLRKHPSFRRLVLAVDLGPDDDDDEEKEDEDEDDEIPPSQDNPEDKPRRYVFEVLTKASSTDSAALQRALVTANVERRLDPPLVLCAGEMFFPFDELETLKATVAAVSPLIAGDKRLKEVVDTVNDLLRTPWLEGSGAIADGLTEKVREAFGQGKRMLPPDYLSSHTERILLQRRCYQQRSVFGKDCLRSLLSLGSNTEPIPTYLPKELARELPMVQRMRTRVLAEVEPQQDQFETHGLALRVVAIGRVLTLAATKNERT